MEITKNQFSHENLQSQCMISVSSKMIQQSKTDLCHGASSITQKGKKDICWQLVSAVDILSLFIWNCCTFWWTKGENNGSKLYEEYQNAILNFAKMMMHYTKQQTFACLGPWKFCSLVFLLLPKRQILKTLGN